MNRYTAPALALSLAAVAGCNAAPGTPEATPQDQQTTRATYEQGVQAVAEAYGCRPDVDITFGQITGEAAVSGAIAASGEPGKITVDTNVSPAPQDVYYIAVHEALHACQEDAAPLSEPLPFGPTGDTVLQLQGLSIVTDKGMVTDIEEGAVEVLAESITGQQSPLTAYDSLKQRTEVLMGGSDMSNEQLANYLRTSDLYGFVGQVTLAQNPDSEDLYNITMFYQQ